MIDFSDVESSYSHGTVFFEKFMREYEKQFMAPLAEMQLGLMLHALQAGQERDLMPQVDGIEEGMRKTLGYKSRRGLAYSGGGRHGTEIRSRTEPPISDRPVQLP